MRNRHLYSKNWESISKAYRESVGNRCEDCGAVHTRKKPIGTDHKDGNKQNISRKNFRARCPRCHFIKGINAVEIAPADVNKLNRNKKIGGHLCSSHRTGILKRTDRSAEL